MATEDSLRDALTTIHSALMTGNADTRTATAALLESLSLGHIYMLKAMRSDPSTQVQDAAETALANIREHIESEG